MAKKFPVGKVLLGAGLVGIPLFILLSSNEADAATTAANTPPAPGAPSLVQRLQGSKLARRTFWFQSLLWSISYTYSTPSGAAAADPPDGLYGPKTRTYYEKLLNQTPPTDALTASVFQQASDAVKDIMRETGRGLRLIPMRLPAALINQINAEARGAYSDAILLQANATG